MWLFWKEVKLLKRLIKEKKKSIENIRRNITLNIKDTKKRKHSIRNLQARIGKTDEIDKFIRRRFCLKLTLKEIEALNRSINNLMTSNLPKN